MSGKLRELLENVKAHEQFEPCNAEWGTCELAKRHKCQLPQGHYGWHMCANRRPIPPQSCLAVQLHELRLSPHDTDTLTGVCQILDVVKQEWGAAWSEWDQGIRDEISKMLGRITAEKEPPHQTGCICADCSGAELTADND